MSEPTEQQPRWPSAPESNDPEAVRAFLNAAFVRLHPSAECSIEERAWLTGQLFGLCMRLNDRR